METSKMTHRTLSPLTGFLALLSTVCSTLCTATTAQDGRSTAGRAATKRYAELGILPAPEFIVVEDIVNYHRHRIPLPRAGSNVALDLRWDTPLPGHLGESVLQIGFSTARVHDSKTMRPLNLALVIDRSGSMGAGDKMRRVKQGLCRFVRKLRPTDSIAMVAYSTEAEVLLPAQRVGDRRRVLATIRGLTPSGNTNLHGGLMLGYKEVVKGCQELADHRVILLTDGLANQGVTDAAQIARDSETFNARGIDLSTIGVGLDFNRDLLAGLATAGRGLFHFVADDQDIQKVFVQEAQSLLGIVARDVEVVLTHGSGVEVARVYGYHPRITDNGFTAPMENFNLGMTGVMMVKFRCREIRDGATLASQVRVQLRFKDAANGKRTTLDERTRFLDPRRSGNTTDHEVRKNFTIAVMGQAMRGMAESARASRYGEAERKVARALEFFDRNYADTDDEDLLQNHRMLEKYRKIVSARIERFRRL
jgi:Ca-activated chloride channel homolog